LLAPEDSQVIESQVYEDFQLFGTRIIPPDVQLESSMSEIDSCAQNSIRGEFSIDQIASGGFSQGHLFGKKSELITASRDDGLNQRQPLPLISWLEGTKLPEFRSLNTSKVLEGRNWPEEARRQELEDIELFRNVHVTRSQHLPDLPVQPEGLHPPEDALEFAARIYYRKVVDCYPSIPHYLAARLAEANLSRSEWLTKSKLDAIIQERESAKNFLGQFSHSALGEREEFFSAGLREFTGETEGVPDEYCNDRTTSIFINVREIPYAGSVSQHPDVYGKRISLPTPQTAIARRVIDDIRNHSSDAIKSS
jgi:hypothetical protein